MHNFCSNFSSINYRHHLSKLLSNFELLFDVTFYLISPLTPSSMSDAVIMANTVPVGLSSDTMVL